MVQPAAARCPPWRSRCAAHASSPASRSKAGIERPEPVPSSPSSASITHGRWWRSAIREATIPMTPGVPALAGQHVGGLLAQLAHLRLGLEQDPRLGVAALGVGPVELVGDRRRALGIVGEHQLEPRVGAIQAPGGVDARREAEADGARVDGARIDLRHAQQRADARLGRGRQRAQPLAHQAAVLVAQRHAVGDRGEGDEVEVLVGRRRDRARRPPAARRRACGRRPAAHRSGHG